MPTEFPGSRPDTYDGDKVYDEDNAEWTDDEDIIKLGGGRYRTIIVTACSNKIFFEEFE